MREQSSKSTGRKCRSTTTCGRSRRTHTHTHDYSVDLICGGFPCQDISVAGKGAGIAGERSGLWHDFARVIRTVRPRWVVIENVPALTARGLGTVLGDLAEIGFDAEWHCVPASAVGAPHQRERIWIVAVWNSDSKRSDLQCVADSKDGRAISQASRRQPSRVSGEPYVADAKSISGRSRLCQDHTQQDGDQSCNSRGNVADAKRKRRETEGDGLQHSPLYTDRQADFTGSCREVPADADSAGRQQQRRPESVRAEQPAIERSCWWESEPDVGRVAHGVPSRVDRLRCLGNAIVPQMAVGQIIAAGMFSLGVLVGSSLRKDAKDDNSNEGTKEGKGWWHDPVGTGTQGGAGRSGGSSAGKVGAARIAERAPVGRRAHWE